MGDLAAVIEVAVTEKLERLGAKRFARTKSPRKSVERRHLLAAVAAIARRISGSCAGRTTLSSPNVATARTS
jgi:hypothetical protein